MAFFFINNSTFRINSVSITVVMLLTVLAGIILNKHLHKLIFTENEPNQTGSFVSNYFF
jgi:hypothetical protein